MSRADQQLCRRLTERLATATAMAVAIVAHAGTSALAAAPAPHWSIVSQAEPTYFKAGDQADAYRLIARNDGDAPTMRGSSVLVSDTLPVGVVAKSVVGQVDGPNGAGSPRYQMSCPSGEVTGTVTCTYEESLSQGEIPSGATIAITIVVSIPGGASKPVTNVARISGGGAPSESVEETTPINPTPVPFGLAYFATDVTDESGGPDTQAGSHPFELTANLAYNISGRESPSEGNGKSENPLSSFSVKDLEVALPPGLIGDPSAVPQCSQQQFQLGEGINCPLATQVGTVKPLFYGKFPSSVFPVYDVAPPPGQPAELGFSISGIAHVPIFFHLRSDGDYGLTMRLNDIPEAGPTQGAILSLWGVPADGSHDLEREGTTGRGRAGEVCTPLVLVNNGVEEQKRCPSGIAPRPFLTLPAGCQGAEGLGAASDSWQAPGAYVSKTGLLPALGGCERPSFAPTIALAPEVAVAGSPSGYTLDIHAPQSEDPFGLATPALQRAVVRLPAGIVLSPSVANGLQACSEEAFAQSSLAPASCPAASQLGTVRIATPLLTAPLEGQVFLAGAACGPCSPADAQEGRMLRLFVQAQSSGVTLKLAGSVSIDQATGALTVTFAQVPQLPFEDLRLTLAGGQRSPLANPLACATPLSATSRLTPYSGQAPAEPQSAPFALTDCTPPQFNPTFLAGTRDNQAGIPSGASAARAFSMTFSRTDADEPLQRIAVRLPPGLTAILANVPPCPEAQAQAQTCGAPSEIGSATVGVGPGREPFFVKGSVYLTGPYGGAPFGLSIVVPVLAGPFDLGAVNVRAAIEVDARTAALTIRSDPWPQSLDGVPLQIKTVNVTIDREGLIVDPTSCDPLSVAATIASAQGTTAQGASRFQAAGCAGLPFAPKLTALTHAGASRKAGVYLHVKLTRRPGEANLSRLRVQLPHELSPRLLALQSACAFAVFGADPHRCPAGSVVGSATAATPLLRGELVGRVYLVSNGNAAPPCLEIVLQGEGVTLRVAGQTSIKNGVTAISLRSLPDVPLSGVDVVLSPGPRSLLTPNTTSHETTSMCRRRLTMPVSGVAQNGKALEERATVAVSGCRPPTKAGGWQLNKPPSMSKPSDKVGGDVSGRAYHGGSARVLQISRYIGST